MKTPEKHCCCHGESTHTSQHPSSTPPQGIVFKIEGLDCVEEVSILKTEIGPLVGGEDNLAFDVINGRMTIVNNEHSDIKEKTIIKAVANTGMKASRWQPGSREADISHRQRSQTLFAAFSGACILIGILSHIFTSTAIEDFQSWFAQTENWSQLWYSFIDYLHQSLSIDHQKATPDFEKVIYAAAIVFGVRHVIFKAFFAVKKLRADMNLLMLVAIIGAVCINEWFEAATVSFLFSLSLAIESWSIGRARHAVEALLDLAPSKVTVVTENQKEIIIPAAEVTVGTKILVKPGEKIALDGEILQGITSVNQAPITGESIPIEKQVGDAVYAGSINGEGTLLLKASKVAADTTLAHIIRLVEDAHSKRAKSEQWVEKFARIYTPIVMLLAFSVFLIPPLLLEGNWQTSLYKALVLLVIACPCALVISTPVSIVAALACAARNGILVKGGIYIEAPAHLNAIAFDKTGTITNGKPVVTGIYPFNGYTQQELLSHAAALEARNHHPLATAIVIYTQQQKIPIAIAENVRVLPGKGVTGYFKGANFWLGSRRYLLEQGLETAEIGQQAISLEQSGQTVIAIGNERQVCGLIALADEPRPQAAPTLQRLKQLGVKQLAMLTGDNQMTALNIAEQIGLDRVHAELLPHDKVEIIANMVADYQYVAMVGDGINDAPALSRANLGIAMGVIGSDAAIETADIALMGDDLSKLPWLIKHSRRTLTIIRQNIVFALSLKAAFAILAFAGMATLWQAIAADMGASLLVVANGLRLLRGNYKL